MGGLDEEAAGSKAPGATVELALDEVYVPPELKPGVKVDRYTLVKRLGRGGMGETWEAFRHEPKTGFSKVVAIKLIRHDRDEGDAAGINAVEDFLREARLHAGLGPHRNIVTVNELVELHPGMDYVMEMALVPGITLRKLMQRRQVAEVAWETAEVVYLGREVLRAILHWTSRVDEDGQPCGIVHRDLKPQNIMITPDADVVCIDFGIAKAETDRHATREGLFKGSVDWASPLQLRAKLSKEARRDPRIDSHAVGLLMYHLLSGAHPTGEPVGGDEFAMMGALMGKDRIPLLDVSPAFDEDFKGLDELIDRVVHADVEKQPSVAQFFDELCEEYPLKNEEFVRRSLMRGAGFDTGTNKLALPSRELLDPSGVREARPTVGARPSAILDEPATVAGRAKMRGGLAAAVVLLAMAAVWLLANSSEKGSALAASASIPGQPPPVATEASEVPPKQVPVERPPELEPPAAPPVNTPSPELPPPVENTERLGEASPEKPTKRVKKPAAKTAKLTVFVFPEAWVAVDGKLIGRQPIRELALAPGRHTIRVGRSAERPKVKDLPVVRGVRLRAHESRTERFDLRDRSEQ